VAVLILILVGIVVALANSRQRPGPSEPGQTLANRNVRFGLPAPTDPANKDAYPIERDQYVLSYSDAKGIPNWVCWNLTASDIGSTKRLQHFDPDPDLPGGFHRVKHDDYTGSGFDRGHMCPSKDRSDSAANNTTTFYTTNIVPQSPACNRGAWEKFESHCRSLSRGGTELYIAAGPHGQGGAGEKGPRTTVGKSSEVVVPAAVWKVVLVLPSKNEAPTTSSRSLAVWMPNDQTVGEDWKAYSVSIAEVESRTGYKFYPTLAKDIAAPIKSRIDRGP
jgi:endonuclease G